MPRSPSSNQDIRDSRRADILRAAAKLFARKGLTDTKIGDIAQEAGLSHGLVYHYFPSKEAIFEAILVDKREAAWADVDRLEEERGLEGAIRELLARSLEEACSRPEVSVMIMQAMLTDSVPERLRATLRRGAHESFDRTVQILARGQAAGCVDATISAEQLAATVFSLIRGVFLTNAHTIRGHRWLPVPEAETILRLVLPSMRHGSASRPAPETRETRGTRKTRGTRETRDEATSAGVVRDVTGTSAHEHPPSRPMPTTKTPKAAKTSQRPMTQRAKTPPTSSKTLRTRTRAGGAA
ncbi:MAG: TetR/AcrR family transcriptional regulator [Sandaracinus sp.]